MLHTVKCWLHCQYHRLRWWTYRVWVGGPLAVWDYVFIWWHYWTTYRIPINSIWDVPRYLMLKLKQFAACFVWAWLDVRDTHRYWIEHLNTEAEQWGPKDWKERKKKVRWYFYSLLWLKEYKYQKKLKKLETLASGLQVVRDKNLSAEMPRKREPVTIEARKS